MLTFLLLLAAFIGLGLTAFGVGHPRLHFGWAGLACFVLVPLIAAWPS